MSNDSINSINPTASTSSIGASSSTNTQKLTAATKVQLEALGVDTTNITTETQGQAALKAAQANQEAHHASKGAHKGNSSMDSIKAEATSLASQVGVSVSNTDKVDDILSNISAKISEMQAGAGDDKAKLAQVQQYETQLEAISAEFSKMQSSQQQLSSSMSSMASSNKLYHNLG